MADSQRKTANLASNLLINDKSAQYATILMFDADLESDTTYTLSFTASANIRIYLSEHIFTRATFLTTVDGVNTVTVTTKSDLVKTSANYQNGRWLVAKNSDEQIVSIDIGNVMFNTGSTALPYEPYGWQHSLRKLTTATEAVENPLYSDGTAITAYTIKGNTVQNGTPTPSNPVPVVGVGELETTGEHSGEYKIPISNGQQTIDIYIGDLPLLKSLDSTAVDEISNGTLTRRVDSDGSVLPTPTTTQITMPSIPTTEGANNITVDTTVQPSEFTATWAGWHEASVKEKSENLFDINNAIIGVAWNTDLNNDRATVFFSCEPDTDYCFSTQTTGLDLVFICEKVNSSSTIANTGRTYSSPISFTTTSETHCIAIQFNKTNISMQDINNLNSMLNTGSTALPYEPYWK